MTKFVCKIILLALPLFLLFVYPLCKYWQGEFYGDISSFTSFSFDASYRQVFNYDPGFERHVVITNDYPSCATDSSVLVIGDSFTQQGRRTFLEYLQNEMPNWTVYNVQTATDFTLWYYIHRSQHQMDGNGHAPEMLFCSMTDFIVYMLQNAETLPNTIIMESTENFLISRLLAARFEVNESDIHPFDTCGVIHKAKLPNEGPFDIPFDRNFVTHIGEGMVHVQKWIRKLPKSYFGNERLKLDRPLFTCPRKECFLFPGDLGEHPFTHEELALAKHNAERLVELADERGVHFILSIVPNKMQLYREFVIDLPLEANTPNLSDSLYIWQGNPHFLLNRPLLLDAIRQGEKDIYLANDIHWSYKAAAISAKALKYNIQQLNCQN